MAWGAQHLGQRDAVAIGQPHVEQDSVWTEAPALLHGIVGGRGPSDDPVPAIGKHLGRRSPESRVVVDNQNRGLDVSFTQRVGGRRKHGLQFARSERRPQWG